MNSFAKEFAQHLEIETRNTMESIAKIWLQIGLSRARRHQRVEEIRSLFNTVLTNSLQTEEKSLKELIEYKETKAKEINAMLTDLTLPLFTPSPNLSLIQVSKLLHIKYNELIIVKNERLAQMKELESKREKLCVALNFKAKPFKKATNIPSEEELMLLQSYISDLSKEKAKRFNIFQSIKKMIEKLFIELEREVTNDFEKELLFEESDKFILSSDNMKNLQNLHSELESIYAKNKEMRKELENKLISLWNKLEVSQTIREDILGISGYKPSVLDRLMKEVERYEDLKRQNIKLFIVKIRAELEEWYEKCYSSTEEIENFKPFFDSTEFNEELLDSHEQELQRLQNYYQECEEIFIKLKEWNGLWMRFIELENKMTDPNRFNNRGGALLAEEKERNQLKRKLPSLQSKIITISETRFANTGLKFCVYGKDVKNYFKDIEYEYNEAKENEKKERQRIKELEKQALLKGKKITPIVSGGVVLRKTPVKRAITPMSPGPNGRPLKVAKMGCGPLTPSRLNNEANCNTVTKRMVKPMPKGRARNLEAQMALVANIEGSILSIDEYEFQVSYYFKRFFCINSFNFLTFFVGLIHIQVLHET